jgi:exopolysaccharide production protein ExoZ
MQQRQLSSIQILRAFAALTVVIFHTLGTANAYGFEAVLLRFLEALGDRGVDVFFVISGFIMVHVQHSRKRTPGEFMLDRAIRIVPLYWTLTAVAALIFNGATGLLNTQGASTDWVVCSLAFCAQTVLGAKPVLYDGWTLEYEMLFYLIFALSLFAADLARSVLLACVAIGVWAIAAHQPVILEFAAGMLIGWAYATRRTPLLPPAAAIAIGVLGLLAGTLSTWDIGRWMTTGIPAAILVYGCVHAAPSENGILTRLGNASYSLYLIQVFTVPAVYKLLARFGAPAGFADLYAIGCIALAVAASFATYTWIESPIARFFAPLRQKMAGPVARKAGH